VIHRDEIHLSTPDSNGRQHITALIFNRISQQSQSTVRDTLSTRSSQQTLQKEKTVKQFQQSSVPPLSIPRWLWFVCLLLSLFLLKRKEF
jgi:ribose/xylose/arabinose/galactoside ABC-type transport system permease subunit